MMAKESRKAVISWSGGMDSTSLLLRLMAQGFHIYAFSFFYGQKHRHEINQAKKNFEYFKSKGLCLDYNVIDISGMMEKFHSSLISEGFNVPEGHYAEENMKATVIPNRNAIFASLLFGFASSLAEKNKCHVDVALGVHSGDHAIYPDCRQPFYEALEKAFILGSWNKAVSFMLPYIKWDKAEILRDALKSCEIIVLDFDTVLSNTSTSYTVNERGEASGRTGSDVERILAFHKIGRKDPVLYAEPWETLLENALFLEEQYQKEVNPCQR